MKINNNCTYRNNSSVPAFKHKIILDIGASNPRGSLKILALTDDGEKLYDERDIYVKKNPDGFRSSEDFATRVINIIKNAHKKAIEVCTERGLPEEEKKLSDVVVFVPGTTIGDRIAFLPNLTDKNKISLLNVDFSSFKEDLISEKTDIAVKSGDCGFVVTKDLGGAGLGIAKILAQRDELKEGDYIVGIMTGGGFGSVDIKVEHGFVKVETSETSSNIIGGLGGSKALKLGKCGVTVKSHISNYLKAIGIDKDVIEAVLKTGDARIVTQNRMSVDNANTELINAIKKSREFELLSSDENKTIFKIDDSDGDFAAKMKKARKRAVNDYAETIALFSINKINECANRVILVGPFAHGLSNYIRDNSEDFKGATGLPDLVYKKIDNYIEKSSTTSTTRLKDLYNFEVICDSSINFPDNTFAGYSMASNELRFVENRGSCFDIPLEELQFRDKIDSK